MRSGVPRLPLEGVIFWLHAILKTCTSSAEINNPLPRLTWRSRAH